MAAVTDTGREIIFNPSQKPGISNLLTIQSLISNQSISELERAFAGKSYAEFKKVVAETLINYLQPLRSKRQELLNRSASLDNILKDGAHRAQIIASQTMHQIKTAMGLI